MISIKNNINIEIAVAPSRLSKRWTNKRTTWLDLLQKCEATQRTSETVAEYKAMKREQQSERKDVGGFVGGYLKDGLRRGGMVSYRTLLTLDIDYGKQSVWEDFTLEFGCAAMLYTTHTSTPEKPRYRLVIPLSRHTEPDEYEPVGRYIAGKLGINMFDHTTYDLTRLFYYPSTPKDGTYQFEYQDGPALDVDEVLDTYDDYHDSSAWSYGTQEVNTLHRAMRKAGDPLEKRGLIGAFCRTYTIARVIEVYLSDVYEPTAHEDRYTYSKGSVAGGLCVYEDKWAYSHHATDPVSGQLCNAFDLVRLHMFGLMDDDYEGDMTKSPSYIAMTELAEKDAEVRKRVVKERVDSAAADFGGIAAEDNSDTGSDDDWKSRLELSHGNIRSTITNVVLILENDPKLKGKLRHNDFSGFDTADLDLPWERTGEVWTDKDDANMRAYLENNYNITGKDKVGDALEVVFNRHHSHPVRAYLNHLKWDGVPRLDRLIIDYIGADDTPINRAMTRKQFAAAVARVMHPGCKYDYCLVMTGGEGIGKSTLLKIMGGEWFSDSLVTTEGKDGMESLRQGWIFELPELASIRKSDVEQVKCFLSKQQDRYRPAYGKRMAVYERQCVFFGTTNRDDFLKGDTGNRRFWVLPVALSKRKVSGDMFAQLKANRDQLWAEAVQRYKDGEKLYLEAEMEREARVIQNDYNIDNDDPVPGMLDEYLSQKLPPDWYDWSLERRRAFHLSHDPLEAESIVRDKFFAGEFIYEAIGMSPKDKDYPYMLKRVNRLMKDKAEWMLKVIRVGGYGLQKGFQKMLPNSDLVTQMVTKK